VSVVDEFNVYTQEAGPGKLTINIDGPSKAKIDVVDRRTGFVTVSYVVDKEGWYYSTDVFLPRFMYYVLQWRSQKFSIGIRVEAP